MTNEPMDYVDLSDEVISVDKEGHLWHVYHNGKVVRTFYGTDAQTKANGYAMAFAEQRIRS